MMRIPRFSVKKQGFNTFKKPSLRGGRQPDAAIYSEHIGLLRYARNDDQHEKGSAIIWILIAIALFAALNFAITQGSRSGGATISKEQAALAATEILDYGRAIKQAVQTLQINGCSDTEVSFENNVVAGYEHTPPARDECKVFHPAGGGLNYLEPEEEWMDGLATSQTAAHYGTWFTNAEITLSGLGITGFGAVCSGGATDDSCRELMTGVPFIKREICIAINKKIGWGTNDEGTPYKDGAGSYGNYSHTNFSGTYAINGNRMGTATPSNYSNIMTGCIEGDGNPVAGTYSFFQVLIVR